MNVKCNSLLDFHLLSFKVAFSEIKPKSMTEKFESCSFLFLET